MYDTRVYKERRRARFESDPEFRLREQQRYRERYQRRKAEKLQAGDQGSANTSTETQELRLNAKPEVGEMIPKIPSSFHNSASSSQAGDGPATNTTTITSTIHTLHTLTDVEDEVDQEDEEQEEEVHHLELLSSTASSSKLLQTVSIKLPQNMAVLVVPVNLTSVTDDDAMQLQQIGRRVAIVRGAMTNVAEFQVLPAMTFDPLSPVHAMETDIRQIVTNESQGDDSAGPTIQITPQVVESESEIVEEVVSVLPPEPQPEPPPPPPPSIPRPKLYVYIEAIRCGRCLAEFGDLLELSGHQKRAHQMLTIEVSRASVVAEKKSSLCDPAQLLSMEDKIAARLGRGDARLGRKAATSKRAAATGLAVRGKASRGGGVVKTVAKKGARTGKASNLLTCQICSLYFVEQQLYDVHMESHQEMQTEVEVEETEFVGEQQQQQETTAKQVKYTIVSSGAEFKSDADSTEHIITDASGNQIVVHAETQEQLQELLASLESGGLQMMNGGSRESGELIAAGDGNGTIFMVSEAELATVGGVGREVKGAVGGRGSRS